MPEQGQNTDYKQRAEAWIEQVSQWENVSIDAQLGDRQVTVTQRGYKGGNQAGVIDVLRIPNVGAFAWKGEFTKGEEQELLDQGDLIIGNEAYMPLEDALKPENYWVWNVGK